MQNEQRKSLPGVEECLSKVFADLLANFHFENPNNPTIENSAPTPTLYVNVKIVKDNEVKDSPSKSIQTMIITNILGFKPEATSNADGSHRLKLKKARDVNKLTQKTEITLNDVKYIINAESDKKLNQGKGIFFRRDLINEETADILEEMKGYGVTEVYPFTRKVQKEDGTFGIKRTGTFKVTFATNVVPKELNIFMIMTKINMYYDKPMYCYNCGQFAHTQKRCKNTKKCKKCGLDDHEEQQCQNETKCVNCLGQHDLNPKTCPTYKFEENCIRYSTLAQVPVSVARKYAMRKITEYLKELTTKSSFADVVKGASIEEPKEVWYRKITPRPTQREKIENKDNDNPRKVWKKDDNTEPTFANTYLATQTLFLHKRTTERSSNVNPHLRAIARQGNRKTTVERPTVSYGDLNGEEMETEDNNTQHSDDDYGSDSKRTRYDEYH